MSANELSVARVLAFVKPWLAPGQRVLEVGCGDGQLAVALAAAGHAVVGLDLRLPEAKPPGVQWVEGDFTQIDLPGAFDAVLFTASLHHINPLEVALERVSARAIIDEFDIEAPDGRTLAWYEATKERLTRAGLFTPKHHRPHGHHTHGGDPLSRWRERHQHEGEPPLHRASLMIPAIEKRFRVRQIERGAYLYRYFLDGMEDRDAALGLIAEEERGIADGTLRPVGLRIVADR